MTPRAQSESVGVILLTAVVVITVGAAGVVVLADTGGEGTTRADLSISVADEGVSIAHNGGDSVAFGDLGVVVRHGNDTWRPATNTSGLVAGDGDSQFESGERWVWRQPLDTNEITTVQVFDLKTNTLLAEERRYPTQRVDLTPTEAPGGTPGETPGGTATATPSGTATATPSETATATETPSETETSAPTPTATPEPDTTPPSVTVDTPNGGEVFRGGSMTTIEWSATDAESGVESIDIEYSNDSGATWTTVISDSANSGSYNWTIPTDNTTNAVVRVTATDGAGNTATDTSDATFTVDSSPTIDEFSGVSISNNQKTVTVGTLNASDDTEVRTVNFTVYDTDGNFAGSNEVTVGAKTANLSAVEIAVTDIKNRETYTVVVTVTDGDSYTVTQSRTQ